MTIQWFPGHMAKARRQVVEKLKLIDVVIELLDARIPYSSRNPMIDEIVAGKPRLILLNKADLADPKKTDAWISFFEERGHKCIAINAQEKQDMKKIISESKLLVQEKFDKMRAKGIKNTRAIRALIVGIPNVGKSTLINRLANKPVAKTGDRPGVTTGQQWNKVGKEFELLDTPGILWPKFEDQDVGYRLAVTGAIKENLLDLQDIVVYSLKFLIQEYQDNIKERYQLTTISTEMVDLFDQIGKFRGCLMSGGLIDYDKTAEVIIRDIRAGRLGRITFETPIDIESEE